MTSSFLHRALRRAFLLSLAVPAVADCGGNVVLDTNSGASGTGTGGTGGFVTTGRGVGVGGSGVTSSGTDVVGVGGSVGFSATSVGGSVGFAATAVSSTAGVGGGPPMQCLLASTTPVTIVNGGCQEWFDFAGIPNCSGTPGSGPPPGECAMICPLNQSSMQAFGCNVQPPAAPGQAWQLACIYSPCGTGRRPAGLVEAEGPCDEPTEVARYLGAAAHLEAVSVVAFAQLAGELDAHGAPRRLVRAARRAVREEERHARVVGRLARRAGARPRQTTVEVAPAAPRSLEAIAVENAVEGCVRETFGAVVAMRQAERARDAGVRRAMKRIAREEAGHAELSWALARWLDGRLDAGARRRVAEARRRAVEALAREAAHAAGPALRAELGVPSPVEARAAIDALRVSIRGGV